MSEEAFQQIVAALTPIVHQQLMDDYKEQFKQANNGRSPNRTNIDAFLGILIADGKVKTKAEEVARDLIEKVRPRRTVWARAKRFYSHSLISMPVMGLCCFVLYLILKDRLPDLSSAEIITLGTTAVILLLLCVGVSISSFFLDD